MHTDIDFVLLLIHIDCLYVIRPQAVFLSIVGKCIGFGIIEVDAAAVCTDP